jgi:phosphoglycolate phosphatase-like HAD superfamily hydrolase
MSIKLLICTLTGAICGFQWEEESILFETLQEAGLFVHRSSISEMMGWNRKRMFEALWEDRLGKVHPTYLQTVDETFDLFTQKMEKSLAAMRLRATEGADELFWYCRKNGIKVALTTGLHRKAANIVLDKLSWMRGLNDEYVSISPISVIDCSVSSTEEPAGSPEPHMVRYVMQKLGIEDPIDVLHISDTTADLQACRRAGVGFIFSLPGDQGLQRGGSLNAVKNLLSGLDNVVPPEKR